MTLKPNLGQIVARVCSGVADMSYAQRRSFENQTGIAVIDRSRPIARSAAELEALYARR